ncbi:hypothetical protein [Streptomyces sp. NBC_01750]|nr:hypothetical protein [Streptomyces sp. NBC_01750]WSD37386.1 hypothetical protein OG966_39095 [Streptomyces sp. NBC_01750]
MMEAEREQTQHECGRLLDQIEAEQTATEPSGAVATDWLIPAKCVHDAAQRGLLGEEPALPETPGTLFTH